MEPFVRRSHLLVSARDEAQVDMSWRHAADAVVLDLADAVPDVEKPRARADIMASAWPGLTGVVLTGAETATDVEEIATSLAGAEKERGIANGSLCIIV